MKATTLKSSKLRCLWTWNANFLGKLLAHYADWWNEVTVVWSDDGCVVVALMTIVNKMRSQGNSRAFLFSFDASA